MNGVTAMDENGEGVKSPIKRLGSTRKLMLFNSKYLCLLLLDMLSSQFMLKVYLKHRNILKYLQN